MTPLAAQHPMKALFVRQSLDGDRLPVGRHVASGAVRGYYIDFREKTTEATWPPEWFPWPGFHRFMGISQWGLGCYERYLSEEGEEWLAAALDAGQFIADAQGPTGAWPEPKPRTRSSSTRPGSRRWRKANAAAC